MRNEGPFPLLLHLKAQTTVAEPIQKDQKGEGKHQRLKIIFEIQIGCKDKQD